MAVTTYNTDIVPGQTWVRTFVRYTGAWVVTLTGATGGTFTLSLRTGGTTGAFAYNASAATIQRALETMLGIGNISVTGSAGGPWTITPAGDTDETQFAVNVTGTALTGTTPTATSVRELKDITGLTYELQARDVAGEPTADIDITSAGTSQGTIANGGTNGEITLTVNRTATGGLAFGSGWAEYVLMEIDGTTYTPIVQGRLTLLNKVFI